MSQPQQQRPAPVADIRQEGSRWYNAPPTAEEFTTWFTENVFLEEGLKHERYLSGFTMIPAEETVKYVRDFNANGGAITDERKRLTYVPYPKVDVRILYFWELMALHQHDWHAIIEFEDVPPAGDDAIDRITTGLPEGFYTYRAPNSDDGTKWSYYVCCTMKISIYAKPIEWVTITTKTRLPDGSEIEIEKRVPAQPPIRSGRGTKQVPMKKKYADDSALMKAETGAKGRALGAAGIFVVPGAGIATAEDMLDLAQQGSTGVTVGAAAAQPPQPILTPAERAAKERADITDRVKALIEEAKDLPGVTDAFRAYMQEKNIRELNALTTESLKGAATTLERLVQAAREATPVEPQEEPEVERDDFAKRAEELAAQGADENAAAPEEVSGDGEPS